MFIFLSVFRNEAVYAQENIIPVSVTSTDADSNGYFTVNINMGDDFTLEAFKIIVNYDSDYLTLKDTDYGYRFYTSFTDKYNANQKGLCAKNYLKEMNQIVFAGAQPIAECAKVSKGERIAYVTFKCKTDKNISHEELVSQINVSVVNFSDGKTDIIKENPNLYSDSFIPVSGDDLRGEKILSGDADDSGKVDLKDAKIVLSVSLGIKNIDEDKMTAADVDSDGKVTLKDAKLVLKYSLGIIKSFE